MKKILLTGFAMVLALTLMMPDLYAQQQSAQQQTTQQQQGWYCPWQGQGRMMRHGQGMGPRMRGPCCMMNSQLDKPLTLDGTRKLLDDYLKVRNNPNLKLGEVLEKGDVFEATIVTKEGSLVEKIQVDKNTGWFKDVS